MGNILGKKNKFETHLSVGLKVSVIFG